MASFTNKFRVTRAAGSRARWLSVLAAVLLSVLDNAGAVLYFSKEEAFEQAFGVGAAVESIPVFLTDEQVVAIEQRAKAKLDSQLFTFYEGRKDGKLLGYAAIESHTVRTQAETLLLVLSPQGQLVKTVMLAFHEPPEYQPPARWMTTLAGKKIDELVMNYGVDGVSGATLSVRAALDSARKVLAVFQIAFPSGEAR
ncbi:MAG: FMN-binding protein [Methylotetracoccus sp.]